MADALTQIHAGLTHSLGSILVEALNDPEVIEIMANPDGTVWIEKLGHPMEHKTNISYYQARDIIILVASSLNFEATVENPIVEGELPLDGSRFEGLLPPVVSAPSFTIRKKASKVFTLAEYVEQGILTKDSLEIIESAIVDRKNILVAGGTGSGKTTFVNAIIDGIARLCPSNRLVIIEDTAELQSTSKNKVIMRTSDFVNMNRLVKATMRYRPDRILVGEVRDGSALELIKLWNTGHPGGVATVHATSGDRALRRMERLIAEITEANMREEVADCIDLVVFLHRTPTGRKVSEIASVEYRGADNKYQMSYWHYDKPAVEVLADQKEPLFIKEA